jgi:hypothetical protein
MADWFLIYAPLRPLLDLLIAAAASSVLRGVVGVIFTGSPCRLPPPLLIAAAASRILCGVVGVMGTGASLRLRPPILIAAAASNSLLLPTSMWVLDASAGNSRVWTISGFGFLDIIYERSSMPFWKRTSWQAKPQRL